MLTVGDQCSITPTPASRENCDESFLAVFSELLKDFGRNAWMLLKPTLTLMLLASRRKR